MKKVAGISESSDLGWKLVHGTFPGEEEKGVAIRQPQPRLAAVVEANLPLSPVSGRVIFRC